MSDDQKEESARIIQAFWRKWNALVYCVILFMRMDVCS